MSLKILVVDDETDIKILFQQKFRKEIKKGVFEFEFSFSAEEAIAYLKGDGSDLVLILSDINMPGMSGLMLLKYIKEHRPELRVIMITAYGDEKNYRQAMDYGADDFMTKPIDFSNLKAKILEFGEHE